MHIIKYTGIHLQVLNFWHFAKCHSFKECLTKSYQTCTNRHDLSLTISGFGVDVHFLFQTTKIVLLLKEFSPNNEGISCYLCLVQGRHDGLILPEVRGQNVVLNYHSTNDHWCIFCQLVQLSVSKQRKTCQNFII